MASDRETTREQRLAANLRANLQRRKAQARALDAAAPGGSDGDDNAALPKSRAKS